MSVADPQFVYLRLRKRIGIQPGQTVTLGQAARLFAASPELERQLEPLVLHRHVQKEGNRVVIDLLQIVKTIREAQPLVQVETFGDPQVLVIVNEKTPKPRIAVLIGAWLLLFFGSGLAIMNFHTDVSMREVHQRISEIITGERLEHPLWFQIPYSFGIGLGMILFFNHLFRKRFNEEPNPLEVELYMYEENVNAYVIADEMSRKNRAELKQAGDGRAKNVKAGSDERQRDSHD